MKIIYGYKRNIYAAYSAAYLRLKLDPTLLDGRQTELKEKHKEIKPFYLGLDEEFNEVYIANCGKNPTIFKNTMEGLSKLYDEEIEVILIN